MWPTSQSRSQHIHIIVFLSAVTLLDTDVDTCIVPAMKRLSPSRGTTGRVSEPTEKPVSYHLNCQWSAKQLWAEISVSLAVPGLLSRSRLEAGGKAVCSLSLITLWSAHPRCLPVPQLPLPCHPTTGKGQSRLASFLEVPCTSSCKGWQVSKAAQEQAARGNMRRQVLGVPSSSGLPP